MQQPGVAPRVPYLMRERSMPVLRRGRRVRGFERRRRSRSLQRPTCERRSELRHVLKAIVRIFRQRLEYDGLEVRGQLRAELAYGPRCIVRLRVEHGEQRLTVERQLAVSMRYRITPSAYTSLR